MSQDLEGSADLAAHHSEIKPAGFGIRAGAWLIDTVILMVCNLPLSIAFERLQEKGQASLTMSLVSFLVSLTITGLYSAYFYAKKGATPGKALLNLRVIDSETGGHPSFKVAFIRDSIGKLLSGFSLCIGYLMVLFRSDKRAMHDLIASTQVVRVARDNS